jgi:hypothetical protein
MHFVFVYENITMKPIKIVLLGMRENGEGGDSH